MGALYRYLDPRELDAIALSHLHRRPLPGPVRLLRCCPLLAECSMAATTGVRPRQRRPRISQAYEASRGENGVSEHGPTITSISTGIPGSPANGSGPLLYGPSMSTIR